MKSTIKSPSLLDFIKDEFKNSVFTYDEIKGKTRKEYNELKEELFEILDKDNVLSMVYDKKLEIMKFKLL
jgi:hypothetical protein